jgi:hypothetical protein
MKNHKKIMTIGDIHGRSTWKDILFGGETEFFLWRKSVEDNWLGSNGKQDFEEYDKIIFVGDYCDSFDKTNEEILTNLKDIILFAKTYPDKVVLLLGNHDVHYIVHNECCSGYRGEMRADLNELFKENEDLFKMAYLDEYNNGSFMIKTLWTHAGVTKGWYSELLKDVNSPSYRLNDFFIGSENWSIDKLINVSWKMRVVNIFNVDAHSGGNDLWAGPIWVRPTILREFNLEGYNQVVGHTPQGSIIEFCPLLGVESNPQKLNTLTFVDALQQKQVHIINRI